MPKMLSTLRPTSTPPIGLPVDNTCATILRRAVTLSPKALRIVRARERYTRRDLNGDQFETMRLVHFNACAR